MEREGLMDSQENPKMKRMNQYLKAGGTTQIEIKRKVNTEMELEHKQSDLLHHQDVQYKI